MASTGMAGFSVLAGLGFLGFFGIIENRRFGSLRAFRVWRIRVASEPSGIQESRFSAFPGFGGFGLLRNRRESRNQDFRPFRVWADSGFFGTAKGFEFRGFAGDSTAPGHRKPKGQPDKPNRVLQGKSPPSIFSGIRGFSWAGFPLNVNVRLYNSTNHREARKSYVSYHRTERCR